MYRAVLSYDGGEVELPELAPDSADGIYIDSDSGGIEGWRSAPDLKVTLTERGAGDGAHAVEPSRILYSARTVTVHLHAIGDSREAVLALMDAVQRSMGRPVRLRVVDGPEDTYADGYARVEWDSDRDCGPEQWQLGTITVVCPDPRRLSTSRRLYALAPNSGAAGGLLFDAGGCMTWPVSFGGDYSVANVAVIENHGTSTAHPVITVSGDFPEGVRLSVGSGGSLAYGQPLRWQPLVVDCLSGTASVNGVDVTRNLTSRDMPEVAPGGTERVALVSPGVGSVSVEVRDTYI